MQILLRHSMTMLALALATTPAIADTVTITYLYDPAGRVTTAIYSSGICISYAYDATGNRIEKKVETTVPSAQPKWGSSTYGCFKWSA